MNQAVRDQYEAFPDPSPEEVPIGPGQLDRLDDSLHFGWSWQRHRFCYRPAEGLRILDAGCGTGLSTLALARLNPGSTVIGVDFSPRSLDVARQRLEASGLAGVEFREHDLEAPVPAAWGPFDFIACRGVLGQAADPVAVLRRLAGALDGRGLLLATFPNRAYVQPARALRQAVEALAGPGASPAEQAALGLELFAALRQDGPIRRYDAALHGPNPPGPARFVSSYLGAPARDWSLDEVARALDDAGLQLLQAPPREPWSPESVLDLGRIAPALRDRIGALDDARLARLTAALDPNRHGPEYRAYACPADFEPRTPSWPERLGARPEAVDDLVPHASGLASPAGPPGEADLPVYRMAGGALGRLGDRAHALLRRVDGRRTCGAIAAEVEPEAPPAARRDVWLDLANLGFILLESTDLRQHVDCRHLGPIRDRLDCACPRRWVRACDLHGHCTIAEVGPGDPGWEALGAARGRLGLAEKIIACEGCADYTPGD